MKGLVYKETGRLQLEERQRPEIQEKTDAIIRVTLASICSSDLHIKHGSVPKAKPGVILGHEFVGVVEQIGEDVKNFKPGQRVAVNVETFCGECEFCREGFVNNCAHPLGGWALGCRIDGGQTEYVRIPFADQGLTLIPDKVTDEEALFVGDILATGYWAAEIAEIKEGQSIAVIGAGPTGACTMMCARLYNPGEIIVIDTDPARLDLALKEGWADKAILAGKEDVKEEILKEHPFGCHRVFEVAGGEETFRLAWQIARPNGIVLVVALYEEPQILPLPDMYGKNLIFKTGGVDASACGAIMKEIERGRLDTTPLITHRYALEDIEAAYELFEKKKDGVIKIAVKP